MSSQRHTAWAPDEEPEIDLPSLSYVEREALLAFSYGLSRDEIAGLMHISKRTTGQALTIAKEKLHARSLAEAAVLLRLHLKHS